MSLHLVEKSRYWKCGQCKSIHETFEPVTGEEADRRVVCCPRGILMTSSKEEYQKQEAEQ